MSDVADYLLSMGARVSTGGEYVLDCPFCGKGRHLYCNAEPGEDPTTGKEKPPGRFICFRCAKSSLQFPVLMAELEGCSLGEARATFNKWKFDGLHFKRPIIVAPPLESASQETWLPPEFEPVSQVWPRYLTNRNVDKALAIKLNLGVCRRHDRCPDCKPGGGCSRNMSHRIILPIDCPMGRSFQARAIPKDLEPRYLSGDNSGQLLFGWSSVATSDIAVIVEGPFDAIKVIQAGVPAVALMGKQLRDTQYAMLATRRRDIILMLDPVEKDPLAIDDAVKIAELFGGKVAISLETDPGDATEAEILESINGAVEPRVARDMANAARVSNLRTWR